MMVVFRPLHHEFAIHGAAVEDDNIRQDSYQVQRSMILGEGVFGTGVGTGYIVSSLDCLIVLDTSFLVSFGLNGHC